MLRIGLLPTLLAILSGCRGDDYDYLKAVDCAAMVSAIGVSRAKAKDPSANIAIVTAKNLADLALNEGKQIEVDVEQVERDFRTAKVGYLAQGNQVHITLLVPAREMCAPNI